MVLALLNDTDISIGIRAAVALAWFLTLRLGESMLSHLTEVYNATRTTRREDVEFVSDNSGVINAVRITTRGAKNHDDPYNEGGIKILCKATQPGALCPVNLFMEYWSVTEHLGFKLHEPLIRHPDGRLVTPQQVRKQIKRHAQLQGFNPDWFGNHSTRIQGATRMLAAEVPVQTMLKQGNWKTKQGIMPYMRHSERCYVRCPTPSPSYRSHPASATPTHSQRDRCSAAVVVPSPISRRRQPPSHFNLILV